MEEHRDGRRRRTQTPCKRAGRRMENPWLSSCRTTGCRSSASAAAKPEEWRRQRPLYSGISSGRQRANGSPPAGGGLARHRRRSSSSTGRCEAEGVQAPPAYAWAPDGKTVYGVFLTTRDRAACARCCQRTCPSSRQIHPTAHQTELFSFVWSSMRGGSRIDGRNDRSNVGCYEDYRCQCPRRANHLAAGRFCYAGPRTRPIAERRCRHGARHPACFRRQPPARVCRCPRLPGAAIWRVTVRRRCAPDAH